MIDPIIILILTCDFFMHFNLFPIYEIPVEGTGSPYPNYIYLYLSCENFGSHVYPGILNYFQSLILKFSLCLVNPLSFFHKCSEILVSLHVRNTNLALFAMEFSFSFIFFHFHSFFISVALNFGGCSAFLC